MNFDKLPLFQTHVKDKTNKPTPEKQIDMHCLKSISVEDK